jgi:hypothetical protein
VRKSEIILGGDDVRQFMEVDIFGVSERATVKVDAIIKH